MNDGPIHLKDISLKPVYEQQAGERRWDLRATHGFKQCKLSNRHTHTHMHARKDAHTKLALLPHQNLLTSIYNLRTLTPPRSPTKAFIMSQLQMLPYTEDSLAVASEAIGSSSHHFSIAAAIQDWVVNDQMIPFSPESSTCC